MRRQGPRADGHVDRMILFIELYPEDQIIIIGRNDDQDTILRSGLKIINSNSEMLQTRSLEAIPKLIFL